MKRSTTEAPALQDSKAIMNTAIGAVSYLNTKPLIYGLRDALPDVSLMLDLPSRLADRLAAGTLDIALIPSVEFLRGNQFSIVTDACIACRGPVRSVCLLFRCPPHEVKTLALDEGSRTSAVLAQVLLAQRFGIRPTLSMLEISTSLHSVSADAVLVIGDRAMKLDPTRYSALWDLGEEWQRDTGLPFVFAMWIGSRASISPEVCFALQNARDLGLQNIESIIEKESPRYGLTADDCRQYFLKQLHFHLGPRELAGLDLFRQQAVELQLLPAACQELSLEPL